MTTKSNEPEALYRDEPLYRDEQALIEVRAAIVDQILKAARFRDAKAEEWPDDPRNARAADALEAFAEFVRSSSDLEAFAPLIPYVWEHSADQGFGNGDDPNGSRHTLSRFGFDRDVSPAEFGKAITILIATMTAEESAYVAKEAEDSAFMAALEPI